MKVRECQLPNGRTLEIHQDEHAESPRKESNNGRIFHWHPRYDLGEEQIDRDDFKSAAEALEAIKAEHDMIAALPVYLLDHSGLTINTLGFGCPWDSGQVGWIVATRATLESGGHKVDELDPEEVKKWLLAEVETFDQFLRGDVYGFVVRGAPCPHCGGEGKNDDSCWGFYGDDLAENGMLDHLSEEDRAAVLASEDGTVIC